MGHNNISHNHRFLAIISDLFPGVDVPDSAYTDLHAATCEALTGRGLQIVDGVQLKITQLHETMIVRHGVMLVGIAATGKTTVQTVLADAYGRMARRQKEAAVEAERVFFTISAHADGERRGPISI